MFRVKFTRAKIDAWARRWPCSSLTTGTAEFDRHGDLVDLSGALARADVNGHEFDAFVDDNQGAELRAARGTRAR